MSTMVQTPVRVEPPLALTGEIISPRLGVRRDSHAPERRADDGVLRGGPSHVDLRSATTTCSLTLAARSSV